VLVLVYGCVASGCANLARKPPTPADDISPRQAAAISAPPGERYFLLIFSSQSTPKRARYTHTWASVVKVTGCDGPGTLPIEEQTVSWLPVTLNVRPLSFRVEQGVNLPLHFTIEEVLRHDERVSLWGPYEVGPGLYFRFMVQRSFLDSGRVGYQAIDTIGEAARTGAGCDCIHSVTDMDPLFDCNQYPLSYFGDSASLNIVRQIHTRPIIICPQADHGWLLPQLGLDKYPIVRRCYHGRTIPNTPENFERYMSRHDRK
jgi:hypothetical protein